MGSLKLRRQPSWGKGSCTPLPASGNDRGGGGCSPQPKRGCAGLPLPRHLPSPPSSLGPGSLCLCAFTCGRSYASAQLEVV